MEKRLSETDKEKRIKIASIIAIILLLLIISLFLLLYKKTYQITFNSNGGSEVASVKVKDGDKLEEPDDPTKEGYIFAGWYYLDELYDFELPVKSDMTLEAEWAVAGNAEVEGIILNVTNLNLAPNGTALLVATLQPEDAKPVKLIWTSSDETIATVDENGNVKALKEGTVTITVTTEDGKYSASCEVKVSKEVASYTVTENANSSSNSNSNNNTPSTPSTPTTPSNPSIPDTPTTPSTIEPSGVSISGAKDIVVGDTGKLTATITPSDANSKTGLKWSSSNSSVVTVDQNGNIKAVGIGSAIITVTTENGKTATKNQAYPEKGLPKGPNVQFCGN